MQTSSADPSFCSCMAVVQCYKQNLTPVPPGCIPCRTHAGVTPVDPQVYAKVEGWRTPEVQRSKGLYVEICILLRQHAKEYSLGYIHAATKSNSTPEIFGPKCKNCTLAVPQRKVSPRHTRHWNKYMARFFGIIITLQRLCESD